MYYITILHLYIVDGAEQANLKYCPYVQKAFYSRIISVPLLSFVPPICGSLTLRFIIQIILYYQENHLY